MNGFIDYLFIYTKKGIYYRTYDLSSTSLENMCRWIPIWTSINPSKLYELSFDFYMFQIQSWDKE